MKTAQSRLARMLRTGRAHVRLMASAAMSNLGLEQENARLKIEVVELKDENGRLRAKITQLNTVNTENGQLKIQLRRQRGTIMGYQGLKVKREISRP